MKVCPDCGCRVYALGCVNCDEESYIEQQVVLDEQAEREERAARPAGNATAPATLPRA